MWPELASLNHLGKLFYLLLSTLLKIKSKPQRSDSCNLRSKKGANVGDSWLITIMEPEILVINQGIMWPDSMTIFAFALCKANYCS